MRLHIITIGEPKLTYAKQGFDEYCRRLGRLHQLRVTHLADKYAHDSHKIHQAIGNAYVVALEITGQQYSSPELASFLNKLALAGKEICFIIGGPDGLPTGIRDLADSRWSMSKLTFPHDLAMVAMSEALYRASMLNAGLAYHR